MPLDGRGVRRWKVFLGKVSGAWVFRGTCIAVAAVFENLEDRLTVNEIVEMFDGLKQEQVKAVLDFAAVRTAGDQGWSTLLNGQLLHAAEQAGFDVLLTDRY
jgi:uncharacterized protein (DUF433 family)